jgi:hypothetical protein
MASTLLTPNCTQLDSVKLYLARLRSEILSSLPPTSTLSPAERKSIIARYSAVLEGNFIYWMTAAYLASQSPVSRDIILDNLREEIRDCHPGMLRRFTSEASADPAPEDVRLVGKHLAAVRQFIGSLSPVPIITMMAFFEDFIQTFMPYLAELARLQGSQEQEYTRVHSLCDAEHSQELFRALDTELALAPGSLDTGNSIFNGVHLLRSLIYDMIGVEPSQS